MGHLPKFKCTQKLTSQGLHTCKSLPPDVFNKILHVGPSENFSDFVTDKNIIKFNIFHIKSSEN